MKFLDRLWPPPLTRGDGSVETYGYDGASRLSSLASNLAGVFAQPVTYGYDGASRLSSLASNIAGTSHDQTLGFSYNPASQVTQNTRSNDAYAWNGHYNISRGYTSNGLNQYTASGSVTPTYDARGNLTSDGSTTFGYDAENRLVRAIRKRVARRSRLGGCSAAPRLRSCLQPCLDPAAAALQQLGF